MSEEMSATPGVVLLFGAYYAQLVIVVGERTSVLNLGGAHKTEAAALAYAREVADRVLANPAELKRLLG